MLLLFLISCSRRVRSWGEVVFTSNVIGLTAEQETMWLDTWSTVSDNLADDSAGEVSTLPWTRQSPSKVIGLGEEEFTCMETREGGNPSCSLHSRVTFFLKLPLESFPSCITLAALVRLRSPGGFAALVSWGSPGGSDEKENYLQPGQ